MSERPRFFGDLAGVAGGAISALAGLREEAEAMIRARTDELIQRLDLVRREELEAIQDLAANARAGQEGGGQPGPIGNPVQSARGSRSHSGSARRRGGRTGRIVTSAPFARAWTFIRLVRRSLHRLYTPSVWTRQLEPASKRDRAEQQQLIEKRCTSSPKMMRATCSRSLHVDRLSPWPTPGDSDPIFGAGTVRG